MFAFSDLFQWDRFITPTIIKTFYWLVIGVICLFGLSGIFAGLTAMAISPFARLPHQRASRRDKGSGRRGAVISRVPDAVRHAVTRRRPMHP